jgi:HEAT repeat protein
VGLGVLLLVLAGGGLARAAAAGRGFASDPVEDLRQALRSDRDVPPTEAARKFRKDNLMHYADRITTLGDLGRAMLLREWRYESLDPAIARVDQDVWINIARRFGRDARAALKSDDPQRVQSAATMVGEMATAVQGAGIRSSEVESALAGFTDDLVRLTHSPDQAVRAAGVRALGKLGLQATGVLDALKHALDTGSLAERRAAGEALINLIRIAAQSEKEGGITIGVPATEVVPLPRPRPGGLVPPEKMERPPLTGDQRPIPTSTGSIGRNPELVRMSARVVPVAAIAVQDPDPFVRRLGVEAIQQAAQNLTDAILLPVSLEFPPPGRPVTSEERERIMDYRQGVHEEWNLLKPLMENLRAAGGSLTGAAQDRDLGVRLDSLRTLEQIGYAREKLLRRWQTMPPEPKETEPKGQDTSKDKSVRSTTSNGTVLVRQEQPAGHPPADVLPADPLLQGLVPALPVLVANLTERDVRVRLAAIDALEMLGNRALPAVPALIRAMEDPDLFVRWAAARTIGKLVPDEGPVPGVLVAAVPGLARLLSDEDLDLRLAAAGALGRFGPAAREAVPALAQSVTRGDEEIRGAAIEALGGIGPDAAPAIPQVIQALSESDPRLRLVAARLLGRFGPAAASAAGPLRPLLNDPDPDVRRAASDAILSILPK